MLTFEFIRPTDSAAAIAAAAQSKTAQQGADVRFMGGGTTLIDLMKLNVETPARVLDVFLQAYAISAVESLAGSFGAFFHRRGNERDPPGSTRVAQAGMGADAGD